MLGRKGGHVHAQGQAKAGHSRQTVGSTEQSVYCDVLWGILLSDLGLCLKVNDTRTYNLMHYKIRTLFGLHPGMEVSQSH